jgi:hypothetical protein
MESSKNFFIASTSIGLLSAPERGAVFDGKPSGRAYHIISQALASHTTIQDLTGRLIRLCELSYGRRDIENLEEASKALCNLPLQSAQHAGRYFQAIALHRKGDSLAALEILFGLPPVPRAIQTAASINYEIGDFERAAHLHKAISGDPVALAGVLFTTSAIASASGNHRPALDVLVQSWPVIKTACQEQGQLWPLYTNEIAFELLQLGRVEEAAKYSAVATASPIADHYPEWSETAREIAERAAAPVIIAIETPISVSREQGGEEASHSFPLPLHSSPIAPAAEMLLSQTSIISRVLKRAPPTGPPAFRE